MNEEKKEQREEIQARHDAIMAARERFQNASGLRRKFYDFVGEKPYSDLSTDEINSLYGGVEEQKIQGNTK